MLEALLVGQGVLWVVVLVLVVALLALARQVGVLSQRIAPVGALMAEGGLRVGEPAPRLELLDLDGKPLRIARPGEGDRSTLLFFLSPACPVCKELIPALRSIARRERGWLDIVLASDGPEDHRRFVARESLGEFSYVVSTELGIAFRVGQLPHAVLIDAAGTIGAMGLVNTREHLESLFEAAERGVASIQEFIARRDVV